MSKTFARDVYCIAGLPFDAVTAKQAVDILQRVIKDKEKCFFSTPNLNFVVASQTNQAFRDSVINSELSVADGMPVVWMAKLLGIPIKERIAGSSLFDEMAHADQLEKPVSVFFFGGQDGVAERACEQLNSDVYMGMQCVGFHNPGFGSVEEMSADSVLEIINRSKADFVVVSLGAGKGQGWIEYNRNKLNARVISHLGAVVNFIAGTVNRSPRWMQKSGLEWLWRIKEEPGLWRRYWADGLGFIAILFTQVLPYAFWLKFLSHHASRSKALKSSLSVQKDQVLVSLSGACGEANIAQVRSLFGDIADYQQDIIIECREISYVDSAFIGQLLLLKKILTADGKVLKIINLPKGLQRVFNWCGVSYLY